MSVPASLPPPARSWRDIPQGVAPVAMSREGRKRHHLRSLKIASWLLLGGVSLWGGYELLDTWLTTPTKIKAPVKATPVRAVSLRTDGVLDLNWVKQRLALPANADLMEIDLFQLRERLMAHPQVRKAVVTRRFPDTVAVVLEERTPVARVRAQPDDVALELCVSRDGVVFAGVNQRAEMLATLPHLEGLNLKRVGSGFAPLEGIDTLSDLLTAARSDAPHLYGQWKSVTMSQLRSDGLLRVRTAEIPEIIFGVRDDFTKQLAQLDYVLDQLKVRAPHMPVQSINLAVGLSTNGVQVPVSFAPLEEIPAGEEPTQPAKAVTPTAPARETALQKTPLARLPRSTAL